MNEEVFSLISRYLPGPFSPGGGDNVLTRCPFHGGGQERKPSFSIDLRQGVFHCFACDEKGTLRTLLRKLNLSDDSIDSELKVVKPHLERTQRLHRVERDNQFAFRDPFLADYILPEKVLGAYNFCPKMLLDKGFDQSVLHDMGVGYDLSKHRITYPIRDIYGNLAGISAGATEYSSLPHPKYKVYQGRRQDFQGHWKEGDFGPSFDEMYPGFVCENHDFLWNYDNLWPFARTMAESNTTVCIVEGFKACLWMKQSGFKNTVALMGSYLSRRQLQLLQRLGCNLVLALDNDLPGIKATARVGKLLRDSMHAKLWVMRYPMEHINTQPDSYSSPELHEMVSSSYGLADWQLASQKRGFFQTNTRRDDDADDE